MGGGVQRGAFVGLLMVVVGCGPGQSRAHKTDDPPPPPGDDGDHFAIAPNLLISLGQPVFANIDADVAPRVVDGRFVEPAWSGGFPTPSSPSWIAIDVGFGPRRVLVEWNAGGNYHYDETTWGGPGAYRIETSSDSTDGSDGSWRVEVDVAHNTVRTRAHVVDFDGQRWVRLVMTAATAQTSRYGVMLDEIQIYDATLGSEDTWFFMGDSITAEAFDRRIAQQPDFAALVHAALPSHTPLFINGGIGGDTTWDALDHIDAWLSQNPMPQHWILAYGTNDASLNMADPSYFRDNMRLLIERAQAAGKEVFVPVIPYASDGLHEHIPAFNAIVEALRQEYGLAEGPDLYTWFALHPEELEDGVHPDAEGAKAINLLWSEALLPLYGGKAASSAAGSALIQR